MVQAYLLDQQHTTAVRTKRRLTPNSTIQIPTVDPVPPKASV